MGQLTSAIKSCRLTDVTGKDGYVYLDREASSEAGATAGAEGLFPHRGRNSHHLILYKLTAGDKIEFEYSLDGVNYLKIAETAVQGQGFLDTGQISSGTTGTTIGFGGGGASTCPPCLVRLKLVFDGDGGGAVATNKIAELQVRTYGTVVR
jgi:hypothetical protein